MRCSASLLFRSTGSLLLASALGLAVALPARADDLTKPSVQGTPSGLCPDFPRYHLPWDDLANISL